MKLIEFVEICLIVAQIVFFGAGLGYLIEHGFVWSNFWLKWILIYLVFECRLLGISLYRIEKGLKKGLKNG